MNEINITSAQYLQDANTNTNCAVKITSDGETLCVPLDPANRHYAEIMRQVKAGELTIQEAD